MRKWLLLIFYLISIFGQEQDTLTIEKAFNMDLEELMNVEINVSSIVPSKIFNSPSTVTVIDQDQIQKYGFSTIPEALQSIAGIDVLQSIIDKNITTSRGVLQNFYANKILLLINNIPTFQPINGDGHLERISIHDIERIEVLKGPASVIYGSNAYTGVVNLILKKSKEIRLNVVGRVGYKNLYQAGFNVNYSYKDFDLFISANSSSEERNDYKMESKKGALYNADSTFQYTESEMKNNFNLLLKYNEHSVYLNTFSFDHSFLGAEPSYRSGANRFILSHGTLGNYKYEKQISKDFLVNFDMTYDHFNRDMELSQDKSNMTRISGDRFNSRFNINYNISENLQIDGGINFELRMSKAQETRNGITDELIRHNQDKKVNAYQWSLFSQINYKLNDFSFLGGARYTNNELFGNNISVRFTGAFQLGNMETVKFIYGESFRAPTFLEMYFNHPTVVGNPDLQPEESKSFELAYLKGFKRIYFQVLGYYAEYTNLIQRYTDETGPPSKYRNFSSLKAYGIETEIKYNFRKHFSLYFNYNYIQSVNNEDIDNYRYVPDHNISAGLFGKFDNFYSSLNLTYYSSVSGHIKEIDSQMKINLTFGFISKFKDLNINHSISVKNLFNSDMLIPEYIRKTPNINELPTTGYGRRVIYTLSINY